MEWVVKNWYILVAAAACAGCVGFAIKKFAGLPTEEQIKNIKQWLLLAVTQAEKELGGGTGKLKLRYVYDMFVSKFPIVAEAIKFEIFSLWVDEALEEMRKMLEENAKVRELVENAKE